MGVYLLSSRFQARRSTILYYGMKTSTSIKKRKERNKSAKSFSLLPLSSPLSSSQYLSVPINKVFVNFFARGEAILALFQIARTSLILWGERKEEKKTEKKKKKKKRNTLVVLLCFPNPQFFSYFVSSFLILSSFLPPTYQKVQPQIVDVPTDHATQRHVTPRRVESILGLTNNAEVAL